jgi:hypothetical protein
MPTVFVHVVPAPSPPITLRQMFVLPTRCLYTRKESDKTETQPTDDADDDVQTNGAWRCCVSMVMREVCACK